MADEYRELMDVVLGIGWHGIGRGNHSVRPVRRLLKEHGTSATGSITKVERAKRNRERKLASKARKRDRQ